MLLWWLGLVGLAYGASATCPQYCSCFTDPDGYVSANCSVQALGQIEPSSVEMLSFQPRLGGYATRLEPRAFLAFRRTKFLWMVNCSVINLPNDVFQGLTYVLRLDVSYNKIRHLNGAVFKPMDSLTTLKLRSNPLELTPWDTIVSDSLQELDLGHCGLRTVPFGTFVGVPRLSRLYLDGNELRTLTYSTVPSTLRYVNLARNRISVVPTDVLTAMSNLRKIDLSKNPVNCTCNLLIMQDWFSGQGILLDNGVTCVEPNQYKGMRLSKINENELCTLEEVKRHRRINDIESYRDSKSHRAHNMIHDPDLQSDQPDGQNYAEILFHGSGLTHMEMAKHYSVLPTDLSDENNKVAASKPEVHSSEMDLVSPTRGIAIDGEEETSKEENVHKETSDTIKDADLQETVPTEFHNTTLIPSRQIGEATSFSHADIETTDTYEHTIDGTNNASRSPHEELADEGYSPVYNMTDLMLSDGEGSGDDSTNILVTNSFTDDNKENDTSSPETFTFPSSSRSEVSDYNYDSHHDYSAEVTGSTTEAMTTFEGSGEPENETVSSSSVPSLWTDEEDGNETTTERFFVTDRVSSSDWTSEGYNASSPEYGSSTSETYSSSTDGTSTEAEPSSTTEVSLASEASSTSLSPFPEFSDFTSENTPSSSSETAASSSEAPATSTEGVSSSTEGPSSSAGPLFPEISAFPEEDEEETTTAAHTTLVSSTEAGSSTSLIPVSEVEVIKHTGHDTKGEISVGPSAEERPIQSTLTYVIVGLLVALILAVALALICKKVSSANSKKKVRLPTDMEASPGTELQDMLLPRPAENGVKILATNGGTKENGKEEEKQVLAKDWDDKNEPIETVTARLSVLAGPQTPVFIHKTLA